MQISEALIKDMLKQGKGANDILVSLGFAPESLNPAIASLISTLITMLSSLMDSIDTNFQDMNSKIDALTDMLIESKNKNSSNSSLPPSRDGYSKPTTKSRSRREKSGKKPGGQVGHKGNGLARVVADETVITNHYSRECMNCPHREDCLNRMKCIATGHIYEMKTIVVDNTHRAYEIVCPMAQQQNIPDSA